MSRKQSPLVLGVALVVASLGAAAAARAQAPTAAPAAASTPTRGMTMCQVERQFGAPSERHAPVGQPPITRWVYADKVVYFEYDHVVHAVVVRR